MSQPRINTIATSCADRSPTAIMTAEQISQRFGGPYLTEPEANGLLLIDRDYLFTSNKTVILPTITADRAGDKLTIWQLSGVCSVSYNCGDDLYSTSIDGDDNPSGYGVLAKFQAVYLAADNHYWALTEGAVSESATTIDAVADLTCIGSLAQFPLATNIPSDYLVCNGSSVLISAYPDLYSFLGTAFGSAETGYFKLPDYRGKFLRAWADGSDADPDAASRTDRGDGETGDVPGTQQADAVKAHTHTFPVGSNTIQSGGTLGVNDDFTNTEAATPSTSEAGGTETRPVNVSVVICIRAKITNIEAVPDIELGIVKGQALTGSGYLATTTQAGTPADADNYVHYLDNLGDGHSQTIEAATDTPWANFFPYLPASETSKTSLTYEVHNIGGGDPKYIDSRITVHIDWYHRRYNYIIRARSTHAELYPDVIIAGNDCEFNEDVTVDLSAGGTDGVAVGGSWWSTVDPVIRIDNTGITKLPLPHHDADPMTVSIVMELTNFQTRVTEGSGLIRTIFLTDTSPDYTLPESPTILGRYQFLRSPEATENVIVRAPNSTVELGGRTGFVFVAPPSLDWASLEVMPPSVNKWATINIHGFVKRLEPPYTLTFWVMLKTSDTSDQAPVLFWFNDPASSTRYLLAALENETRSVAAYTGDSIEWRNLHAYNSNHITAGDSAYMYTSTAFYPMVFQHTGVSPITNAIRNTNTPDFVFPAAFTQSQFTLSGYSWGSAGSYLYAAVYKINGYVVSAYNDIPAYSCPLGPDIGEFVAPSDLEATSNVFKATNFATNVNRTFDIDLFEFE